MKTVPRIFLLNVLAATLLVPGYSAAQEEIDCRMVAANVKSMIEKAPEHTLTVVEDALVAAPGCVCEIVKSAIDASKADGPLVKKIVYTAVKTTQQHAPVIAECAVAAAPQHADFVRAAFAEAFEDKPGTKKPKSKKPTQVATAPPTQPEASPQPKPAKVAGAPQPQPSATKKKGFPFGIPGSRPEKTRKPATEPAPVLEDYERLFQYPTPGQSGGSELVLAETTSGKQVVEFEPTYAYDAKEVIVEQDPQMELDRYDPDEPYRYPSGITFFGGPPIDMTGLYLVPPVASAPPFFPEEPEEEEKKVRSVSTTIKKRTPPPISPKPRPPKPPVISRPMSPTGP